MSHLASAQAPPPRPLSVPAVSQPPSVDGALHDWPQAGWHRIAVTPALDDDDKNRTGHLEVELQAVVVDQRLYMAFRWRDDEQSSQYRPWRRQGGRYRRSRKRDDMLAVRWHMSGDYDRSMLADRTYSVDVWLWSAGRSDQVGIADDSTHLVSSDLLEDAAEHELPSGRTVYIRKRADDGTSGYANVKPGKGETAARVASIELRGEPGGSRADVAAKGQWRDGYWHLELSRALDTGHADDVVFGTAEPVLAQVAVFNQGYDAHKSVSEPLLISFPTP